MTPERLQEVARNALDFGIRHIQKTGALSQMFHLVKRDGDIELWFAEASVSNSENAKSKLAAKLRERVAMGDVEAVIMIADAYVAENVSPENDAIRRRLRMTIEQAADYGLCEKREAVTLLCESRLFAFAGRQFYKRIDGKIELDGEPRIETDVDDDIRIEGRFSQWFPAEQGRA